MPKINPHSRHDMTLDPHLVDSIVDELRKEEIRRQNYSNIVKEAFARIEKLYLQVKLQKKMWRPPEVRPIVDEFLFNPARLMSTGNGVDNKVLRLMWELNPIRILEVSDLLLRTISSPTDEKDRQALFDTYFYNRYFKDESVMLVVLCLTTQLAAGAQNAQFLKCCVAWMKESGLDSFAVSYIATEIVKELSQVDMTDKYRNLPEFAPEFGAIIVMAIAKVYREKDRPEALVNQMAAWIECYPSVCFMPPHSSIFELFRWSMQCVTPEPRLHAALLSAMHRAGRGITLQVIPHIMQIIQEFKVQRDLYCQKHGLSSLSRSYLKQKRKSDAAADAEAVKKSYEDHIGTVNAFKVQISRLFQIIQMLISSECLEENEIQPIFQAYEGSLEFRFNFYLQLKNMYGVLEEPGLEPHGLDSDLPLKKQLHGKFNHHRKTPKRSKPSNPVSPYVIVSLTEENESAYLNKDGDPIKYTIEESDGSEMEDDDDCSEKQLSTKFKSTLRPSMQKTPSDDLMDLSSGVSDLAGRNGRAVK